MATDPVCGMQVDEKVTPNKTTYGGKTYYFCSSTCKDEFMANPQKYADQTVGAK